MRLGLDLLGSDSPPDLLYSAACEAAEELPSAVQVVALGREAHSGPVEVVRVTEEIATDDAPLLAVRRKRNSSIAVGMEMVKRGELDALISTGNTGALVASAALTLPPLNGVDRPGLLAVLPTLTGSVAVIDIGANVAPRPHHYLQFARMGAAYQQCSEGVKDARVGLLNIGTEVLKGTKGIREAYRLLQDADLTFAGNIEGRDVFRGEIDVLVCDGFAGNIFLKTVEGISMFIIDYLREILGETPALDQLERRFSYAEYPGALVCGVGGVVVKCHGFSNKRAIVNGIKGTARLVEANLLSKLDAALAPR